MLRSKSRYHILLKTVSIILIHALILSNIAWAQPIDISSDYSLARWTSTEDPVVSSAMKVQMLNEGGFTRLPGSNPRYDKILEKHNAQACRLLNDTILVTPEIASNDLALAEAVGWMQQHKGERFYRVADHEMVSLLRSVDETIEILLSHFGSNYLGFDERYLVRALNAIRTQNPKKVLVVGGAVLYLSLALAIMGVEVVFVDLYESRMRVESDDYDTFSEFIKVYPKTFIANVDSINTIEDESLQPNSFDMALLLSLIGDDGFQGDMTKAIQNSYDLVKSGGTMFLPTTSSEDLRTDFGAVMPNILSKLYIECTRNRSIPVIQTSYDDIDRTQLGIDSINVAYTIIKPASQPIGSMFARYELPPEPGSPEEAAQLQLEARGLPEPSRNVAFYAGKYKSFASQAKLLDTPHTEVELANLLGFNDKLKDHGFGMEDFREAIEEGPIRECILDRFFIPTDDNRYRMKDGLEVIDFMRFLNNDYPRIFTFYLNKGVVFNEEKLFEIWVTRTREGLKTALNDMILNSFQSPIRGAVDQGFDPVFKFESANTLEQALVLIINPDFEPTSSIISDSSIYQEVLKVFQSLPKKQQIDLVRFGLQEAVQYLKWVEDNMGKQSETQDSASLSYGISVNLGDRVSVIIQHIEDKLLRKRNDLKFCVYHELPDKFKTDLLYTLIEDMDNEFRDEDSHNLNLARLIYESMWRGKGNKSYRDAIVAFSGNTPIAIWGFRIFKEQKVAWDEGVYVIPEYQKNGIANALRDAMLDYLERNDIEYFRIGDDNNPNSGLTLVSIPAQRFQQSFIERHPEAVKDIKKYDDDKIKALTIIVKAYTPEFKYSGPDALEKSEEIPLSLTPDDIEPAKVSKAFEFVENIIREEDRAGLNATVSKINSAFRKAKGASKLHLCVPIEVFKNSPDSILTLKRIAERVGAIPFELVITGVKEGDLKLIDRLNRSEVRQALSLPQNLNQFNISTITENDIQDRIELLGEDSTNPKTRAFNIKDLYLELLRLKELPQNEYMAIATDGVVEEDKDVLTEELTEQLRSEQPKNISVRILVKPEQGKSVFSLSFIINDWLQDMPNMQNGNDPVVGITFPVITPFSIQLEKTIGIAWNKLLTSA